MRWEKIEKIDYLFSFFVWLVTFTVYFLTLGVSIGFEDFAEFQTAAYVMGVPHAPGYPLIVIWGKLFTYLPFGSIAYRVNLSNAVISAAACSVLFVLLRKFSFQRIVSIILAISFGFTATYWSQSVMVEVYTMAVLFFLTMLYFVRNWKQTEELKDIYLFAFFSGLGVTAHYTNALNFLVLLSYLLYKDRFTKIPFKHWCIAALFFFCGLLPFAYLPIASSFDPIINVGETDNFKNFIYHLMRKKFNQMEFGQIITYQDKFMFVKYFFKQLWNEFNIGVIFALGGLSYLWKKSKEFFILSSILFIVNSFVILFTLQFPARAHYEFNVRVYYFCAFVIFTLWIGLFVQYIFENIKNFFQIPKNLKQGLLSISYILIVIYPIYLLYTNYEKNDRSDYYIAYNHAKDILLSLEKNSVLFTFLTIETEFPLAYVHGIERQRSDVTIISRTGMIYDNIYEISLEHSKEKKEELRKIVEWDLIRKGERPVYYDDLTFVKLPPGYKGILKGLVYKIVPIDSPELPSLEIWKKYSQPNNKILKELKNYGFITRNVLCRYTSNQGYSYQQNGMVQKAIKYYNKAIQILPYNETPYLNLCSIHLEKENYLLGEKYCKEAYNLNKEKIEVYQNLSQLYMKKKEYNKADEWIDRGIKYDSSFPDFYRTKGYIYHFKRQYKEAYKYFLVYLKLSSNPDPNVKKLLETYKTK